MHSSPLSLLALWALCLGLLSSAILVDSQTSVNATGPTPTSSLQSLFSASLQPLEIKFLPAQSNVFFLPPNQTQAHRQFEFAPSLVSRPNLLLVPNGLINGVSGSVASNQISTVPSQIEVPHTNPSPLSIQNDTLLLQNPFASAPYQSNSETINSLIANLFNNFNLQSLPPEEIIFGSLPSRNSTITRTFVADVFNDGTTDEQPPTETTTETGELIEGLAPVELSRVEPARTQPESEPDVNLFPVHSPIFDKPVEMNAQWNAEVTPAAPETTTTATTESQFNEEVPVTEIPVRKPQVVVKPVLQLPVTRSPAATPVTITPVAPTMEAEFESNRIEPIQPWPTVRRVDTPFIAPVTVPTAITTQPPTTEAPKLVKVIKPTKLNSLQDEKFFQTTLPILFGKSVFSFELNNKKILGSGHKKSTARVSPRKPIFSKIQKGLDLLGPKSIKLSQLLKPHHRAAVVEAPRTQSTVLTEQSKPRQPSSPSPRSQSEYANLVNIISLPNYKFYLGKKT